MEVSKRRCLEATSSPSLLSLSGWNWPPSFIDEILIRILKPTKVSVNNNNSIILLIFLMLLAHHTDSSRLVFLKIIFIIKYLLFTIYIFQFLESRFGPQTGIFLGQSCTTLVGCA